jgi:ABC-type branched-subunit amino acid transport system substrate-binding protein
MRKRRRILIIVAIIGMVAAGCSSTPSSSSAGGKTYTVGVLADITGLGASANKTVVQGVKAGTFLAKKDGYTIKYIVADTATAPSGVVSGAQKLVEEDHVSAVIVQAGFAFAAAPFMTAHGVPVIGAAEDGPEWITSKNMFSVFGPLNTTVAVTTLGKFFKMEGVTRLASLGYSVSVSSSESAIGAGISAQYAGLKAPYVNGNFPYGGTNVTPVALAMKADNVDGFIGSVEPNTSFALITALRQLGVHLKVGLLPTGYGGDLTQAGPGALQAAQNIYFLSSFEPVEMHTPATEQFVTNLRAAGISGDPTFAEYIGYTSVAMLVQGLQAMGPHFSQAGLIKALQNTKDFTAAGLFGSHKLNLGQRTNIAVGVNNCYWVTKLVGSDFHLVPNADPICGTVIPGKTITPSS